MVKNNLTNFVKFGVRHKLLLAGLCEGVWCGVSGCMP